ncbi:hypothetical protein CP556_19875 [Natrinema sp. CBA1119]|uniref:hypothetical protein n=1 Tax=Natrinema sp. CBA1119 TaxID=1608465 RepID=UPI000BF6F73A|nr:hypothetical protein [Natrinema sp. CBA1119]PGF18135.1 hypothetical protein CP556_19875 [Natrinema sp. CBA1119]
MDSDWMAIPLGFLVMVLLVGLGVFILFHVVPDEQTEGDVHIDAYPFGPEKPIPLNSSNVVDYTVTYEERLFYNDLLASRNHSFDFEERVIANCTAISVSNGSTDEFRVGLECRGGIPIVESPWSEPGEYTYSESEEFTYAVTYHITENTTQQTELRNYPFGTDRGFGNGRDPGNSSGQASSFIQRLT